MTHSQSASKVSPVADLTAVTLALVFPTLLTYVYFTLLSAAPTVVQNTTYAILKIIQFSIPLVWVRVVQRQKLSFRADPRRGMFLSVAFGTVVLVAMWCLYKYWLLPSGRMEVALQPVRSKIEGFGVDTLATYATLTIFYSLIHSGLEEYYWRWFVFGQLRRLRGVSLAIFVSSLGFTAHHVLLLATFFGWTSALTWIFSAAIAVGGCVWAWLYNRSGSLYGVWASHMLVDVGVFLIGFDLAGIG
jgi:membrane protease YdiL (CAAX protease family)